MTKRLYFLLFLAGLFVSLATTLFQKSPGYMDADYYYAGGVRLAEGYGFTEPYVWNYLGAPAVIPQPSHTYWMPLASLLAAIVPALVGASQFDLARLPFIFLAAMVPPLTAVLTFKLTGKREAALLSGVLAIFSGFYLPFISTTDTFAIEMVVGTLFLMLAGSLPMANGTSFFWKCLVLGLLAGVMHLSRADGILWVVFGFLALTWGVVLGGRKPFSSSSSTNGQFPQYLYRRLSGLSAGGFAILAGYLLVMGPWFLHNLSVSGSILSPGNIRSLWILNYDEIFIFPASVLTFHRWLSQGIGQIIGARWDALIWNLKSFIGVQAEVFLLPLIILGIWQLRRNLIVQIGIFAWAAILLVMTLVFPFSGERGGFFHSGAALQPLIWAVVPIGFEGFIEFGRRHRNWNPLMARRVFGTGIVIISIGITGVLYSQRALGSNNQAPIWNESWTFYQQMDGDLKQLGGGPNDIVMVSNPPGYYAATGRSAIVIPEGGMEAIHAAADFYHASYLWIEKNHVSSLDQLYDQPASHDFLQFLHTAGDAELFRISP